LRAFCLTNIESLINKEEELGFLERSKKKIRFENAVFESVELEIFEEMVDFKGR